MIKNFVIIFISVYILGFILFKPVAEATAPIGNYLELYGGYLKAVSSSATSLNAFSFEAWIKPESTSGIQKILSIGDAASGKYHYEVGINGGSLQLNYRYSTNSYRIITSGSALPNVWNHVAVTIDGEETRLYLDGKRIYTASGAWQIMPIGPDIVVGRSYLELLGNDIYKGTIDDVRISSALRNISELWNGGAYNGALSADSDTVILWHLDEKRGESIAHDASGNDVDATLIGADTKIHFFGILPTATPFILPTIEWRRPVLPTLSFPRKTDGTNPMPTPTPEAEIPTPTTFLPFRFERSARTSFR